MKVLADTTIWVDHLRHGNAQLSALLEKNVLGMHEFVIGELACGNLPNRERFLDDLDQLPKTRRVPQEDALAFLEMNKLQGQGLGWIDVHLLASSLLTGASLWTLDKSLRKVAEKLRIAF